MLERKKCEIGDIIQKFLGLKKKQVPCLNISAGKPPGKREIDACLKKEPVLKNRNFLLVKIFCRNKTESLKKK